MSKLCRRSFLAAVSLAFVAGQAAGQSGAPSGDAAPDAAARTAAALHPELTPQVMYRLLVGDVALQRGELVVAARAYYEVARETGSAALAQRGTEIALATRQRAIALEAARQWAELDPDAERPRQLVIALSAGNPNRAFEALAGGSATKAEVERALAAGAA